MYGRAYSCNALEEKEGIDIYSDHTDSFQCVLLAVRAGATLRMYISMGDYKLANGRAT